MRLSKQNISAHRARLLEARASGMRHAPTSSEARFFELVRGAKLGVAFRRQVVVLGRFIADFFAPTLNLVVEIDGSSHSSRGQADARRDLALKRAGMHVLRLDAQTVVQKPKLALELLIAEICRLK